MNNVKKYLKANPNLPEGLPANIAKQFEKFANELGSLEEYVYVYAIYDDSQWELAFQKLLEAKDCAVRAVLNL